jgi:DNA-directed RNA polymerase subunit RPC12/RpoP
MRIGHFIANGQRITAYEHVCSCGDPYWSVEWRPSKRCPKCSSKSLCVKRRYERQRAQTIGRKYQLSAVAERDGFKCHICGKRVDMSLPGTHPLGPTADHLVPVADGGGDDEWNVALAHRQCNVHRGRGAAQLMLHAN